MNLREPPHLPVGTRRLWRCFSLLLLPAFAPKAGHSVPRSGFTPELVGELPGPEALPYLPTVGAPPLRFKRVTPPPDLVTRPPAAPPPLPASTPVEMAPTPPPENFPATTTMQSASETTATSTATFNRPAPARIGAPAILPDDTRTAVRTEDFLPYFQLPGAGRGPGDVNVIVPGAFTPPSHGTLPPSSATYTQTPK